MIIRAFILLCIITHGYLYMLDAQEYELLQKAAAAYKEDTFDQAEKFLQQIEHKSSEVWYDLGNISYKKNEYDLALAYWRVALREGSSTIQQAAHFNIHFLKEKMNIESKESFFQKMKAVFYAVPLIMYQCIFLLCWLSLLFFIKNYKHGTRYTMLFCMLLLILTTVSGVMTGLKYHNDKRRIGIVMKQNSVLFAGPDEQYHALGHLERAMEVTIEEQRDSWYKISTVKESGWVMHDVIAVV